MFLHHASGKHRATLFTLLIALLLLAPGADAQGLADRITFQIGAGAMLAKKRTQELPYIDYVHDTAMTTFTHKGTAGVITFYPKFHVVGNAMVSVSAGVQLMFGISSNHRPSDFDGALADRKPYGFAYSVPLMLDLNFGKMTAGGRFEKNFGVALGAGYGISRTGPEIEGTHEDYERLVDKTALKDRNVSIGPRAHAALLFNYLGRVPIGFDFGYQKGTNTDGASFYTISLICNY